jgi:hypothetical protein
MGAGGSRGGRESPRVPLELSADKNLCDCPIGAGTTPVVSRNSKSMGMQGPSRSTKGKAVSSNMTCLEMMTLLEERSRQWYPL